MHKSFYFSGILMLLFSMQSIGQYYKVIFTADSNTDILNAINIEANIPPTPPNYNPYDLEGDNKTEILITDHSDSITFATILDGLTFTKKYDIKRSYNYNNTVLHLEMFFGFYDIDGDNEREGIFLGSNYGSTNPYGLTILNVRTQSIEYFNSTINASSSPIFNDLNNDGYIELIVRNCILGHSSTPVAQQTTLSKKSSFLVKNYPNPTTKTAKIDYTVPKASFVDIAIFNAAGKLINTLVREHKPAGKYSVTCNGNSDNGENLAPGEYYYTVKIGEMGAIKKMILLK